MWETVRNVGVLMLLMVCAFFLGIFVASFIYKRRMRSSFVRKKKVTGFLPEIQDELWDLVIHACFSDLRFLAMLGYDSEIRNVLEDPILMDSKYLEESPLLPGEIALVVVNDKNAFIEKWEEKNKKFVDKISEMDIESSMLFSKLYSDFNESLSEQSEDDVLYFLFLQTPKTMCVIVLNVTFNNVLAVTPVMPELHSQVLDLSRNVVVRSAENFEKLRTLVLKSNSDL